MVHLALALLSVVVIAAQQPAPTPSPGAPIMPGQPAPTPTRGARAAEDPQKGTAVLRGYVTAADTGDPLRRALVRAFSQEGRNSGVTTTDADGRFEIKELPGGRYSVSVSKAGYVTMAYGQRRPEQQGTVLEIPDGTTVDKIAFSLPRGGVITGNVLDEFGDPVADAQVTALRFRYTAGSRRLLPSGGAQTDDRGSYRIYGLAPGDYYLSAVLRSPQQMMSGPGQVSTGPVEGYARTYYPGTPNAAEASRITVKAAQEFSSISLALVAERLARVSGRAVNSSGAPVVQGFVSAAAADRSSMGFMTLGATTGVDGSFQLVGVPPGTYQLMLRPRGILTAAAEFASMRVTVGGTDLDNVLLFTSRGAIARGTITTDEGAPPPLRPEQVMVMARPVDPEPMIMMGDSTVNADWTFEITGLSEPRLVTVNVAQSADWAVKAVYQGGVEITDTPLEFVPGQTVDGLNIVLTRKLTEISGQIVGEGSAPDTDATVVAFSDNPEQWTFTSRYIRSARPNQDGRYTLRGLPPHDYWLAAVKSIEPGQFQDPAFLDSLRGRAVRVTLNEGGRAVQDLKSSRP